MTWEQLTARLEGEIVVLEPLAARHEPSLFAAAQDQEIFAWLAPIGSSAEYFSAWLNYSLAESEAGREGAFATIDRLSGEPVGSTRYMNLREAHRGLEIGFTWLAPSMWGTGANVEAKLLMLEHAFERLDCMRVEFKTDARNERSRRALAALPAQFEGILRKHMIMPGVGVRDSAYYSITDEDWPQVRANLERRLELALARRSPTAQQPREGRSTQ